MVTPVAVLVSCLLLVPYSTLLLTPAVGKGLSGLVPNTASHVAHDTSTELLLQYVKCTCSKRVHKKFTPVPTITRACRMPTRDVCDGMQLQSRSISGGLCAEAAQATPWYIPVLAESILLLLF